MSQLTPHFNAVEFSCRSGECVPDAYLENLRQLCERLEVVRRIIGKPIRVVSGYRSPSWNRLVKGAKHSQHLTASAADIRVAGMTTLALRKAVEEAVSLVYIPDGGLGFYPERPGRKAGWIHLDVGRPRRWKG